MLKEKNNTMFTFDEMQQVMFHLRHSCDGIDKVPQAINKIYYLTNLSDKKIESILLQIGDNNHHRLEKVLIKE